MSTGRCGFISLEPLSLKLDKLRFGSVWEQTLELRYSRRFFSAADLGQQHRCYTCIFYFLVVLNPVFDAVRRGLAFWNKLRKFWEVLKTGIHVFGATFPKWISVPLSFVFLLLSLPLDAFFLFLKKCIL